MAKKTDLSIRISKIRSAFCGDDNHKFAQEIGLTDQAASSICTGNKPAGQGSLEKILKAFPRVNRVWLFLGEGDMLRPEPTLTEQVNNTAIGNNVTGDIVQGKEQPLGSPTDLDRLITLLENKDRQIDRLITLLEDKLS